MVSLRTFELTLPRQPSRRSFSAIGLPVTGKIAATSANLAYQAFPRRVVLGKVLKGRRSCHPALAAGAQAPRITSVERHAPAGEQLKTRAGFRRRCAACIDRRTTLAGSHRRKESVCFDAMPRSKHSPGVISYYETLRDIFSLESRVLTGVLPHAGERGRNDEERFCAFLERVLPRRFSIGSGFIVCSVPSVPPSSQIDLVIFDEIYNAPLHRELAAFSTRLKWSTALSK